MHYEITSETVAARLLAAVHRQVPAGGVSAAWRPALDLVWAYLRRHEGLRTDGHNVFVYRHAQQPGAPMEVDFGVEVSRSFEGEGEVALARTPAGDVAWTRHLGPIDQLGAANTAVEAWCSEHGRRPGGVSWEIYGDPGDDPAIADVWVYYLLGPAAG